MSKPEIISKVQMSLVKHHGQDYSLGSRSSELDYFYEIIQGEEFIDSFKLLAIFCFMKGGNFLHDLEKKGDALKCCVLQMYLRTILDKKDLETIRNQITSTYPEETIRYLLNNTEYSIGYGTKRPWDYKYIDYHKNYDRPPLLENVYSPKGIQRILNTHIEALHQYIDYRGFHHTKTELDEKRYEHYNHHNDILYKNRASEEYHEGVGYRYYRAEKTGREQSSYYGGFWSFLKIGYSKEQKINAARALIAVLEAHRDNRPIPQLTQKQWAVLHEPGSELGRIVKTIDWILATLGRQKAIRKTIDEGTGLPKELNGIIEEYAPIASFT